LHWVGIALVVGVALSIGVARDEGSRTEAERVETIASEIRCPTCRGLSAAESDAKAAGAIRTEIRDRLRAGESAGEIRIYLVSRYGEQALLRPSGRGVTGLVWALPVSAVVVGGSGLAVTLVRWRARAAAARPTQEDRDLVDRALSHDGA
jgi:cytochrome c-type biogenesis protein CcmH